MKTYNFVGADQSGKPSAAQTARCAEIWDALKVIGASASWRRPDGISIFSEDDHARAFSPELLDNLRERSGWFSGWWLSNFTTTSHPSWMDGIAAHYGAFGECHWSVAAFRELSEGLSQPYVCRAPLVCGEMGFDVEGAIVNPDVAGYQERMRLLHNTGLLQALDETESPVIVEIGTGYGALAHFIKKVVPHATYYLIDLPISLQFAGCYLSISQTDHPVRLPGEEVGVGDFVLVPADRYKRAGPARIDLAINTLSFNEMPPEVVSDYGKFISDRLAPNGALFEQNFINTYGQEFFSVAAKALKPHFKTSNLAPGIWRWGNPTIWRN